MFIKDFSTHKLCRWFLIHSYLYYQLNTSILEDSVFDNLCQELLTRIDNGDTIPEEFKKFINKEDLESGSGYSIYWREVPQIVKDTAYILASGRDFSGNKINLSDWLK